MSEAGFDQTRLAEAVGTTQQTVSAWLAKGILPEGKAMVRLPGVLGVSGHWLLTNEGPRDLPTEVDPGYREGLRQALDRIRALEAEITAALASASVEHPVTAAARKLAEDLARRAESQPPGRARRRKAGGQ